MVELERDSLDGGQHVRAAVALVGEGAEATAADLGCAERVRENADDEWSFGIEVDAFRETALAGRDRIHERDHGIALK